MATSALVAVVMGVFAPGSSIALASSSDSSATGPLPNPVPPKPGPPPDPLPFSAAPTTQELFRARVFEEPLVPIGGEPSAAENADLAAALRGYAHRSGPDDFSSLTAFLDQHPNSVWRAALLTGLGVEYYNTAHYSLALEAWKEGWDSGKNYRTPQGKAVAERAGGELAYMYARLGRTSELEAFLQSVEGRVFSGLAGQRLSGARQGLWTMKNKPEIAFFCGPQALLCIKQSLDPQHPGMDIIRSAASTPKGCSMPYLSELSQKLGLNYQMAFREKDGDFVVPSVVHWKLGHYAALLRQEGDLYLLQDPTFRNDTWATRQALEAETSGYFLVPPGSLPKGWRAVDAKEGDTIWGKGFTSMNDPGNITRRDLHTGPVGCRGMLVPQVHLMTVNLSLVDEPVGYKPPVGPPVSFGVRYNSQGGGNASNLGPGWSCDWLSYIADAPANGLANVTWYTDGGYRTFTGFDTNSQSFASQLYDETKLIRTSTNPISYTMLWPDGSQMVFNQSDGSVGTTRNVFVTQMIDPQGNAVSLAYDTNLLLVAITDAIGQVTTVTYGLTNDPSKITRVTDPFGRFATFDYVPLPYERIESGCPDNCHSDYFYEMELSKITDVSGLTSQVTFAISSEVLYYASNNISAYFVYNTANSLITPYGTNSFFLSGSDATSIASEITYPDGSRDRVEFNTGAPGIANSDPASVVPLGIPTLNNNYLDYRNTFYWSRNACANSYRDYSKARIYHWLHAAVGVCSGVLESTKEPLENRVWYGYSGQTPNFASSNNLPTQIGRVLDDGTTQLLTYGYNGFGRITNSIDPLGRTFSYLYSTNGIDLLEIRMTRLGKNELLFKATYNSQHRPLSTTDAAGQTTSYTYNIRGQVLSVTNARNETLTFHYDTNGYLCAADGPLPGTNDTARISYDAYGRPRTVTDVSGYTLTVDYDSLDRITQITHPDGTFEQVSYYRLDPNVIRDRAGRLTQLDHDSLRQVTQVTDPLGRATRFEWCRCGGLKSLTDTLGRTTSWLMDVQGRTIAKQFDDGSQITYSYENTTSRVRQVTDEKQQLTYFLYNPDNTFRLIGYANATVPTPAVSFTYDADYERVTSATDGAGTTLYAYLPVTATPSLGAGRLASVSGPLTNEIVTYSYDELGRPLHSAINGVDSAVSFDAASRIVGATNALGSFSYAYDGASLRLLTATLPNGQTAVLSYGNVLQDPVLQRLTHQSGTMPLSEFLYTHDVPNGRIATWSQQAGTQPPNVYSFTYDAANQLLSAMVTNSGALSNAFAYSYDLAANRLSEQAGASAYTATYNALNQLSTTSVPGGVRTNEWDGVNRLTAVNSGNQRTEFTYDSASRLQGIRQLVNGIEVSHRLLAWSGGRIAEERDTNGVVTKRFFGLGVQMVTGTNAGLYYYTRDHLGSIRELTDTSGNVRARYAYDPFGRRTKTSGDLNADFGFAGMFFSAEANLYVTHFRAYDPDLGRWLSRDRLKNAELAQGPNLYAYAGNEPVGHSDPEGLCTGSSLCACFQSPAAATQCAEAGIIAAAPAVPAAIRIEQELANHGEEIVQAFEEGGACVAELPAVVQRFQTASASAQSLVSQAPQTLGQAVQRLQGFGPTLSADPGLADTMIGVDTAIAQNIASQNLPWALQWATAELPDLAPYAPFINVATQQELFGWKLEILEWFLRRLGGG